MASIHPFKGYLNTLFRFYGNGTEDIPYDIYYDSSENSTPVLSGVLTPNIPHSIKLHAPGKYTVVFNDGTSSSVFVEDGYKFGGSRQKAAYIFDNTPWCMIVMLDRTYFYNQETKDGYVELISPDDIEEISCDFVLLKNKDQDEISLYSLNEQKPILWFSNIICSTEESIVWRENDCLVIYSLLQKAIVHRIKTSVYSFDKDNNRIIFGETNVVKYCKLSGEFIISRILSHAGELVTFVNNELSIFLSYSRDTNESSVHICKLNDPNFIDVIQVNGYVARINDISIIDIESRHEAICDFDLEVSGFPEATIETLFSEFIFYPCTWDIFYVQRETKMTKTVSRFQQNGVIYLRSVKTGLNQIIHKLDNKTIINDSRFVLYNDYESFVRSKWYSAAGYRDSGKILVHRDKVILVSKGSMLTLSRNGYWDNPMECDYDFSLFESFGVIRDNDTGLYKSLFHNIKGKNFVHVPRPNNYVRLDNTIILEGGKVYSGESVFYKLHAESLAVSSDSTRGIIIEDNKVYILDFSSDKDVREQILEDIFDASKYRDVILSEDGSQILYRDHKHTHVTDIITDETTDYENMSYIQQLNGIRPHFQRAGALKPRIVNPITGQLVEDRLMKQYVFLSPDGRFYADTLIKKYEEYYYIETDEIIPNDEYNRLISSLKFPPTEKIGTSEWEEVKKRRVDFIKRHFSFLNKSHPKLFHDDSSGEKWDLSLIGDAKYRNMAADEFVALAIQIRGIAIIRDTESDKEVAKIRFGLPLLYLNYVSFSMDSRYVAIAGYRDRTHGLFLVYDLIEQTTLCMKETPRAVWTTAFSSKGHLAAYTSNPYTIYFEDNYICSSDDELKKHILSERSFLTFSPDGHYMALSNQGYVPQNEDDSWGHQPSTFVEIRQANIGMQQLATFNDLSDDGIANISTNKHNAPKSVASVSFSQDNKRLMMVGNDGVVIIRNLHLDNNP